MTKDNTPGRDGGQLVAVLSVIAAIVMVILGAIWGALGNMPF